MKFEDYTKHVSKETSKTIKLESIDYLYDVIPDVLKGIKVGNSMYLSVDGSKKMTVEKGKLESYTIHFSSKATYKTITVKDVNEIITKLREYVLSFVNENNNTPDKVLSLYNFTIGY